MINLMNILFFEDYLVRLGYQELMDYLDHLAERVKMEGLVILEIQEFLVSS